MFILIYLSIYYKCIIIYNVHNKYLNVSFKCTTFKIKVICLPTCFIIEINNNILIIILIILSELVSN